MTVRPWEFFDNIHTSVTFEFDLNYYKVDRDTYNTLDWLGDLGGLYEALIIILGFASWIVHFQSLDNYMVSKLYRSSLK